MSLRKMAEEMLMDSILRAMDEENSRDLKPCPLCGGRPLLVKEKVDDSHLFYGDRYEYAVICRDCKLLTRKELDQMTARKLWNHRSSENRVLIPHGSGHSDYAEKEPVLCKNCGQEYKEVKDLFNKRV